MFHYHNRSTALAAVIGATLAAGTWPAVADVKVYGKVHMSVDYLDAKGTGTGGDATSRRNTYVSSNSSRWGLDVSEKLGSGPTAIAKLESELDASGETASQNTRNRYVGMKGSSVPSSPVCMTHRSRRFTMPSGFSRTRLATSATLRAVAIREWDPAGTCGGPTSLRISRRTSTALARLMSTAPMRSPRLPWKTTVSAPIVSACRSPKRPLYVAYGHESHRYNSIADGGQPAETGQRLAVSYNFGAFKVAALLQDLKDLGGTLSGGTSVNRKGWTLGGAYTTGNNVFKLHTPRLIR